MLPEGTGCSQHFKRFAAKMRDYWQFIDELFRYILVNIQGVPKKGGIVIAVSFASLIG